MASTATRVRCERGWTVMEMLIALLLSSVVLGTATAFLSSMASLNGTDDRQSTAADTARRTADHLATQLRNAGTPVGAARPIYSASSYDLVFYQPMASATLTNNARGLQWVRYCLDYTTNRADEKLWMQTASYNTATASTPPSTATCPAAAWSTSQLVASKLNNNSCSATPCTWPNIPLFTTTTDAAGAVRDVAARLRLAPETNRTPLEIATSVEFRNAKAAPNVVVTCNSQNNGHATCDASKSTDPDGEALSYKWKVACCSTDAYSSFTEGWETGQTNYLFDRGSLTSGKTYQVTVEVTDASGVYTDGTATVAIQ